MPIKVQVGQPVSFSLGRPPVNEVVANDPMLQFEEDKVVPAAKEGDPPITVKGKAVLTWGVTDGPVGPHAHRVSVKLDDATSESLRKLITDKTRESLMNAAKVSRGG